MSVRKLGEILADIVYPRGIKCIACDAELDRDTRYCLCDRCQLAHNEQFCTVCGRAISEGNLICDQCKSEVYSFVGARSSCVYEGVAATLVRKLKYYDARYLAPVMAEFMADTYYEADWQPDLITYVPIHKSRRWVRGYNQAELLAKELSVRIEIECRPLLCKTVKTKNMARLKRAERQALIYEPFAVVPQEEAAIRGKKILLIDDVLTTGSTANECARVLRAHGSGEVYVLTFAAGKSKPQLI